MMDRRAWLIGSAGVLAATSTGRAQPPPTALRLGLLGGSTPTSPESSHIWQAFFQRLRELGYVEGQNLVIESRFYGDSVERLPALAAELVQLSVDVIVADDVQSRGQPEGREAPGPHDAALAARGSRPGYRMTDGSDSCA